MDISTLEGSGGAITEADGGFERVAPADAAADMARVSPFVSAVIGLVEVKTAIRQFHYGTVATLTAAQVFRDCSLRLRASPPERRACRTLMRQAAIKWRRGQPMGD